MAQTDNYNFPLIATGAEVGTWGGVLNNGIFTPVDSVLGASLAVSVTVADVNLTVSQFQHAVFILSGALTGNRSIVVPLSPNSATVACGGKFIVVNGTSGGYNVTVKTIASGSTGVTVPQGFACALYSDGTNVNYDNTGLPAVIQAYAGDPNGFVAGTAGSVNTPVSMVFDYTNLVLYACTTTGVAAAAVWTNTAASGAPLPTPEGYLTLVSNTPIITSDATAATVVYYTPYLGAAAAIHNGTTIIPYRFSQLSLTLTASQAASNIYDIFLAYNGGTPVIGTGPSWVAGTSGSITAGACARGTGVGGTAISRATPSGLWVNTASIQLIWNTGSGNTTITVGAGQGVFLGSIFMDGSAGQVTCNRSYGPSRKWGVSNAYNTAPTFLKAGDSTPSWNYNSATYRPANGATTNSLTIFSCLATEVYDLAYMDRILPAVTSGAITSVGIGYNSTTTTSGTIGYYGTAAASNSQGTPITRYLAPPALGINVITALESVPSPGGATNQVFYGTESNMMLSATWRV